MSHGSRFDYVVYQVSIIAETDTYISCRLLLRTWYLAPDIILLPTVNQRSGTIYLYYQVPCTVQLQKKNRLAVSLFRHFLLLGFSPTNSIGVFNNNTECTTVYITPPPRGGFPSQIARQPRGCQYGTVRLQKALGEVFPTPSFLAPALLIVLQLLLAVEIPIMETRPRGV